MTNFPRSLAAWRHLTNILMSRCRTCGSSADVISYDPRGLWAYPIRTTYCPDHCPDHDYRYEHGAGHYCNNCGQEPPHDYWVD